jgi:DNA-directed RNA polymerase specialized sigma24 family protein
MPVTRESGSLEEAVRCAAEAGARSVASSLQVVRDAAQRVVEKWQDRKWRGEPVEKAEGWAWRVGRNEAIRRCRGNCMGRGKEAGYDPAPGTRSRNQGGEGERGAAGCWTPDLEAALPIVESLLTQMESLLTQQERTVVESVREKGTLNAAAKALGMDRSNLRRVFRRVLRKLEDAWG